MSSAAAVAAASADELPAYETARDTRRGAVLPALIVVALVIMLGTPVVVAIVRGDTSYTQLFRSYPGQLTAIAATLGRALVDLAGWLTAGSLAVLMFLLARPGKDRVIIDDQPEWHVARWASIAWAVLAAAMIVIDAADANGLNVFDAIGSPALGYLLQISYLPVAWIVVAVLATIAAVVINFAVTWVGLLIPLWCSAIALLAPVVVGQILVGPGHDFGTDAGTVQTIAAAALFGSAILLALRVWRGRLLRPATLRRFWLLGVVAWALAAGAAIVLAFFKLAGPGAWVNPTWYFVIAQGVVLAATGVLLFAGFRAFRAGFLTSRRVTILATSIAACGVAFFAIAEAMMRVPPPQYFLPSDITEVYLGFDLPIAPNFLVLATNWRPNILFLVIAAAGLSLYYGALWRLRRRGDHWPLGRTIAWTLGWVTIVVATSSGFGQYSGAHFGIHMIVHMTLNMLGPLLLVMGGVVTLLLRATTPHRRGEPAGPHEWLTELLHWPGLRILYNPLVVFVLYIASYYGLYLSGLFEAIIRYHWAHQAMNIHFLIAGYLFYGLVIGVDRPPRPLPPIGKLGFVLAAMPFHAFFGIILMTASVPVAENFYATLDLPWNQDLMAAQYLGGGVAWAGGEIPLIIVVVALGIQWARQDQREAARKDRHLDSGLDDDFDAYNRMLARLQARGGTAPVTDAAPAVAASTGPAAPSAAADPGETRP